MAATASLTIQGEILATPSGGRRIGPVTITSAAANGEVQRIVLQAGANTITVPTVPATNGCVIVLPSDNTSVTTLKGLTGDTGIAIGKTTTTVLNWDPTAAPASFVLTSVSTQTAKPTEIVFY